MECSLWPAWWRTWDEIVELARRADRGAWCGLWFADHLMPDSGSEEPDDGDCRDAWAILPALAAVTDHIRLGPLVAPVTFRHPATLASAATTLAEISDGRFVLGVGAGWQRNEHAAYHVHLGTRRERSDRFEEACTVLRALLDDDRPSFHGRYFSVDAPPRRPRPSRRVPLLVGAKGEQRTMVTAARHAQEWNAWGDADLARHKVEVLARLCEAEGRDPSEMRRSVNTYLAMDDDPAVVDELAAVAGSRPVLSGSPDRIVEQLGALTGAGIDEVVLADWNLDDPARRADTLDRFEAEVLPALG